MPLFDLDSRRMSCPEWRRRCLCRQAWARCHPDLQHLLFHAAAMHIRKRDAFSYKHARFKAVGATLMICGDNLLTAKVREGVAGGLFAQIKLVCLRLCGSLLELARRVEQFSVVVELLSRTMIETPPSARWCTEVNMFFGSAILHSNHDPASGSC